MGPPSAALSTNAPDASCCPPSDRRTKNAPKPTKFIFRWFAFLIDRATSGAASTYGERGRRKVLAGQMALFGHNSWRSAATRSWASASSTGFLAGVGTRNGQKWREAMRGGDALTRHCQGCQGRQRAELAALRKAAGRERAILRPPGVAGLRRPTGVVRILNKCILPE